MLRRLGTIILSALLLVGGLLAAPAPASAAPVSTSATVYFWNDTLLELLRRQTGATPGQQSRAAALLHAGLFDAINAGYWARQNYRGSGYGSNFYSGWRVFENTLDDNLAAGIFAHDMLIELFPAQAAYVGQRFAERHGTTDEHFARRLANRIFDKIIATRATDGSTATPAYTPDTAAGAWRPTGSPACTAVTPHWGQVKPFVLSSGSQFRPALPGRVTTHAALLRNTTYTADLTEVRNLGRRDSTTRTAAQTATAHFWSHDTDGTYGTVGQLLAHTQAVAQRSAISADGLRVGLLFSMTSLALADAAIASWDAKYLTAVDTWRPETAVRNDAASPVPTWQPLAAATPCSPSHVSENAAFAGAWAGVARIFLGTDSLTYTVGTQNPQAAGATRTFSTFTAAANEHAVSRVHLGASFRFDTTAGLTLGSEVATQVTQRGMVSVIVPESPGGK